MRNFIVLLIIIIFPLLSKAQTDMDAIMMEKNQLCLGPAFSHSSWKNYWEGNLKRDNQNLGTVTTQSFSIMGSYGISGKLNLLFNVPYIKTKASAGTLHSMQGFQDLSLFVKYMPVETKLGKGTFSVYAIGGVSTPLSNYVADYLPLSIGLRSKTASARLMIDYQVGNIFATSSATYLFRDNISIDRNAYYTTEMHLTNKVGMPDATNFNFRAGYRSSKLIAEAILNKFTTLGGFDISRNNLPFPSNRMNATTVGANFKIELSKNNDLAFEGGGNTTIAGRNVGQATLFYGSIFYIIDFTRTKKSNTKLNETK